MSSLLRRAAAVLLAAVALAALVALSRAPYVVARADEALVRLSWSGRPERIEHCRERSDEELERLPAHMRLRVECEGRSARYAVRVLRDGTVLSTDTVTGGGLRGDRSIHMLREYRVAPGVHAIAVDVTRTDTAHTDGDDHEDGSEEDGGDRPRGPKDDRPDRRSREQEERRRQRQERLPPRLRLDTTVTLAPGAVVLVSYDPILRQLVASTGRPSPR